MKRSGFLLLCIIAASMVFSGYVGESGTTADVVFQLHFPDGYTRIGFCTATATDTSTGTQYQGVVDTLNSMSTL